MKRIIFIAAPAAGKGTLSELICHKYHLAHISVGDMLRNIISSGSSMGKMIDSDIKQGILVDDRIMIQILKERLEEADCLNGYIIDGFPRSINQAHLLHDLLGDDIQAIHLDISKEVARNRILGRLVCPNCKRTYNVLVDGFHPEENGICNDCHTILEKRHDDNEESFEKRYHTYLTLTYPLVDYYRKLGVLIDIDGTLDQYEILKRIEALYD